MTLASLADTINMPLSQVHKKLTGGQTMKYSDAVRLAEGLGMEVVLMEVTDDE